MYEDRYVIIGYLFRLSIRFMVFISTSRNISVTRHHPISVIDFGSLVFILYFWWEWELDLG